ncbi:MAG: hypothetical protein QM778_33170 [Myxococcales bacterium]
MAGFDELDALEAEALAQQQPELASAAPQAPAAPAPSAPADVNAELDALEAAAMADQGAPAAPDPVQLEQPEAPRRVNITRGGEVSNVGEENLAEAYRQGYRLDASEAPTDGTVQLLEGDRVNTYDAADPSVREKLAAGAQLATPDEVEREYSDFGSQAAAFGEGVAQGGSLGLYGLATDAVGGKAARAERKLREEHAAEGSIAGNIVGSVGSAVVSGGSGALAQAARTISPAAQLAYRSTQLGNLATRLGAAVAPRVAASAAGRIGLAAALGAGEGAIDNAARQVFDDLGAGNVDGFADRALESFWEGAKWGGGFGAGAGVLGEAAERIGRKAAGAADEAVPPGGAADEAIPSEPDVAPSRPRQEIDADLEAAQQRLAEADATGNQQLIDEAEDRVSALVQEQEGAVIAESGLTPDATINSTLNVAPGPEAQGILAKLDANLNKAKNARDLQHKLKDQADQLSVSVEGDLDNLQRFETNVYDTYTNRTNKPKVIRGLLEQEGVVWTHEEVGRWMTRVDKMEKVLDDMTDVRKHAIYSKKQLKDFEAGKNALKRLREHLTGLKDTEYASQRALLNGNVMVPRSARIIGANLDSIAETIHAADLFKTHLGSFARQVGGRPATTSEGAFQRLYMGLRADLQNPKFVGKAFADFQTVNNAAITRAIRKSENFHRVAARAGSAEGGGQHGFADVTEYDAEKIGAMLDNLGNPRAWKDARDFLAGLTAKVELMETQAKYYPMPDEALAQITQARQTLEAIKGKMQATKEVALKAKEAQRLAAQTSNVEVILNGLRTLPGAGAAIGTVTTAAGNLAGSLLAMGKGAAKSEKAIDDAVKATIKNHGGKPPELPIAKQVRGPVGGVGISANAVRRAIEDAEALQDPQSTLSRRMAAQLEDVRAESPELAAAIGNKAQSKAAFILSKLPPAITLDPFKGPERVMDPITELRVARYVNAAKDPKGTLKRMSDGSATLEDLETMRDLYGQMFQTYRDRLVAQVGKGKFLPTMDQRGYLHWVTGVPMSAEQQPQFIAGMAAMRPPAVSEPAPELPSPRQAARPKFRFTGGDSFGARSDAILSDSLDG